MSLEREEMNASRKIKRRMALTAVRDGRVSGVTGVTGVHNHLLNIHSYMPTEHIDLSPVLQRR